MKASEQPSGIAKGISLLITGNFTAGVFGIATTTLIARQLGVESYGIFALFLTIYAILDQVFNFQAWQAITKFAAGSLEDRNMRELASTVKYGIVVDFLGAAAASIAGIIIFPSVLSFSGADGHYGPEITVVVISLAFNISGTCLAVHRLYDNYKHIAQSVSLFAIGKLALTIAVYLAEGGIFGIVFVWYMTAALQHIWFFYTGLRLLRRKGVPHLTEVRLGEVAHKGIVAFTIYTNLSSSIRLGAQEFDVLVVSRVLGVELAGLYKLIKQYAAFFQKFADPIQQVIYPTLAKMMARSQYMEMKALAIKIGALAGGAAISIVIAVWLVGDYLINDVLGPEFEGLALPMAVYFISSAIYLCGIALRPMMLSAGRAKEIMYIYVAVTPIYFVCLWVGVSAFGLVGASLAQIVFYVLWAALMVASIKGFMTSRRNAAANIEKIS